MIQLYKVSLMSGGFEIGYPYPRFTHPQSSPKAELDSFCHFYLKDSGALMRNVDVSRLSRYTEIDHKGQKIFENDVVLEWIKDDQEPGGGAWSYSVIKMHQGSWCVCGINYEYKDPERLWDRLSGNFEIYGSIFDHPELSKEGIL